MLASAKVASPTVTESANSLSSYDFFYLRSSGRNLPTLPSAAAPCPVPRPLSRPFSQMCAQIIGAAALHTQRPQKQEPASCKLCTANVFFFCALGCEQYAYLDLYFDGYRYYCFHHGISQDTIVMDTTSIQGAWAPRCGCSKVQCQSSGAP